jgi:hypothetical protein
LIPVHHRAVWIDVVVGELSSITKFKEHALYTPLSDETRSNISDLI